MKLKLHILFLVSLTIFALAPAAAFAQTTCPAGTVLSSDGTCRLYVSPNTTTGNGGVGTTNNTTSTTGCPSNGTMQTITINGVQAQVCNIGYTPLEPIPGLTSGSGAVDPTQPNQFGPFIFAIFKIMIVVGALLAVGFLTLGGVQYMTSSAVGNKTAGLDRARAAMYGLILLAGIWLILNTINPKLTLISLNPGAIPYPGAATTIASSATSPSSGANGDGTACGTGFPNGCASGSYCATTNISGLTQNTCTSDKADASATQNCSAQGGTYTYNIVGSYCYLPAYSTQSTCAANGGTWNASWASNSLSYCYK